MTADDDTSPSIIITGTEARAALDELAGTTALRAQLVATEAERDTLRNAGQALADEAGEMHDRYCDAPYHDGGPHARFFAALANWRAACGNTTRQEQR